MKKHLEAWTDKIMLTKLKAETKLRSFLEDQRGMGTIEIILIIVVLVGLVMIFKKEISGLVQDVIAHIKSDAETIYN